MASNMNPSDLDGFLPLLSTVDTKLKLTIGNKLQTFLSEASDCTDPNDTSGPNIQCSDIGLFIDSLIPWIQSSNYKVSLQGIEIMIELANKMKTDFKPYVSAILPITIDRLGDNKETIRDKAQFFLIKLIEIESVSIQNLFDRLSVNGFNHKNSNVREQCLKVLDLSLINYGTKNLIISKLIPFIVKLLSDPQSSVRDSAFNSLVIIYKFVGDRFKVDLTKKYQVPPNKLSALLQKFDDIKLSGELEPSAMSASTTGMTESLYDDEVDKSSYNSLKRNTLQSINRKIPPQHSSASSNEFNTNSLSRQITRTNSVRRPTHSAASSDGGTSGGGVNEEIFEKAFEDVPSIQIYANREIDDHFNKIRDIISNTNQEWNKRVEALKKIRSLVIVATHYEELPVIIKSFEQPIEMCVKDLRSQVVRETCITISYLSKVLRNKFDHFAEYILSSLILLIPNSAKVISTSSHVAIRFILTYTQFNRLIPVITKSLSSKSKDIRRACCEFIELILKTWQTNCLEKQNNNLQEAIKKGVADADPEARGYSRKAYWNYIEHFPDQGEALLNALDPVYKRTLMSNSSSTTSLSRTDGISSSAHAYNPPSSGLPSVRKYNTSSRPVTQPRSSSAIDVQAVQRAKVRAQYAAQARQKIASGVGVASSPSGSLSRSRKNSMSEVSPDKERAGRTRSRVSISTPTSRSGSPSGRLSYNPYSPHLQRPRRGSNIPRSNDTSRESSPNRFGSLKYRSGGRPPIQPLTRPVMAQRILQQSREAETALADALDNNSEVSKISPRKSFRNFDDHSDESETSSLCSERSYDSYRRTSDTYSSWNGSQNRIYRDICESTYKDIGDIITNCESTHWNDRKDGLVNLQCYLQSRNTLSPLDLKRITDIFTKMFMDSHTKVFSLFLDCFNELIITHHTELNSWLYLLITRLLNKLGADLLGSIHSKILKSLDVVKHSFPPHLQLNCVFKFLTDPTQTPNHKVKIAALNYISKLSTITDPCLAFPLSEQGSKDYATLALTKMIGWTMGENIKQGVELRKIAQDTILCLFNLNTPQITFRFSLLPQEYQEAVANLVTTRVRKSSTASSSSITSEIASSNYGKSSGYGKFSTSNGYNSLPTSPPRTHSPLSSFSHQQQPLSLDNTENLNPDEIHKSLRRTTDEIQQKYSNLLLDGAIDRTDSISYDSGISQMSSVPCIDDLNNQHLKERNENDKDSLTMNTLIEQIRDYENSNLQQRKASLCKLHEEIQVHSNLMGVHFKSILHLLLSLCDDEEPSIVETSINILNSMIKKPNVVHLFNNYIELVVLRVLSKSKMSNKDIYKACENCSHSFAIHLPSEHITRLLFPLIVAEDYPINLLAIKMLTKIIEHYGKKPIDKYIENIMPALLTAYENEDSSVRKCSVFCMVALYKEYNNQSDGNNAEDVLTPYINKLSGAKLKLLQLYIKRSQIHVTSSVPTSPKSNI